MENLSSGAILILVFLFCFVVVRFILLVGEKLLLKYLRKKFHCEFEFTYYNFTLLSTHVSVNAIEFSVLFPSPPVSNSFACEKIKTKISSIRIHWLSVFQRVLYKKPISLEIGDVNIVADVYRQVESPIPSFVPQTSSSSYTPRESTQDFFIKYFILQRLQCSSFTIRFDVFNPGYRLSECAITFSMLRTEFDMAIRDNHLSTNFMTPEISLSINYPKGQILRVYCPLAINYKLPLQIPCAHEEFLEIVFSKFNIECEIKAIGMLRSFIKKPINGLSGEQFSSSTQLIHSSQTAQKLLKLTHMPRSELRIHDFCAEINAEREMKTLELSMSEISIMKTVKDIELVEVDNARSKGSRRKPFRTSWSIESMAACERTSLLFELKETVLRSHDIEVPLVEANHLRCNVEVENGRVSPMRIIFIVHSTQLTVFLNLDEAFLWYKLTKAGMEWTPGPSIRPFSKDSSEIFKMNQRHRKSKSDPAIKSAYDKSPLVIEYFLSAKINNAKCCIESHQSKALMTFRSLSILNHKHADSVGIIFNVDKLQSFTESVLGKGPPAFESGTHHWGTLIGIEQVRLGTSLEFEGGRDLNQTICHNDVKVYGFTSEVSNEIAENLTQLIRTVSNFVENHFHNRERSRNSRISSVVKVDCRYADVSVRDVTVYVRSSQCPELVLFRLDTLQADRNLKALKIKISGVAFGLTQFIGAKVQCLPSDRLDDKFFEIKESLATFELSDYALEKLSVEFPAGHVTYLKWSPRVHILFHESVIEIINHLRSAVMSSPPTTPMSLKTLPSEKGRLNLLKFISANLRDFHFIFNLDTGQKMELRLINFGCVCNKLSEIRFSSTSMMFDFDDHAKLINIEDLKVTYKERDDVLDALRREKASFFKLPRKTMSNRVLCIESSLLHLHFPFNYVFRDTFEHCIATFKMIKKLYKHNSEPFSSSKLPPDLVFRVKKWLWTIEDDPLEIQLRSVYDFHSQEVAEQQKRQKLLDDRIKQMEAEASTYGVLSPEKRNSFYEQLADRNILIYLARIRKMKAEEKWIIGNLFSWTVDDFALTVFADKSMNGYEPLKELLLLIDQDLQNETVAAFEYSTMWGRVIQLNASNWRVQLRDYPTDLVKAENFSWTGTFCGAEQHGTEEQNWKQFTIDPGQPWSKREVMRNLAPLKFFHDIEMNYDLLELGWGPCLEAAWGEFQHAFDRITSGPPDNSPALPWWDKQRLKYRGKIVLRANRSEWHHLSSKSPYAHEERLCWQWKSLTESKKGLTMNWVHGKISFLGDLIITINTRRKWSNIKFIEMPNLTMDWIISWNLPPNGNHTGHNVFPSSTILKDGADTYDNFRSRSLDLEWRINVPKGMRIFLFSTTLNWLSSFWKSITDVARPIKRGNGWWADSSPSKKKFSRHYNKASLLWRFDSLVCEYRQSFSKNIGFVIQSKAGFLESKHLLKIEEKGPLAQEAILLRPRAEWSMEKMTLEAKEIHVYLKNASSSTDNAEKNFFASLDNVKFRRFAEFIENADRRKIIFDAADFKALWKVENRDCIMTLINSAECGNILKKNLTAKLTVMFSKNDTTSKNNKHQAEDRSVDSADFVNPLNQLLNSGKKTCSTEFVEQSAKANEEKPVYTGLECNLRNCQVLLKGFERPGFMCLTADNINLIRHEYCRAWRDGQYLDKFGTKGTLTGMQLFSLSVDSKGSPLNENEHLWVPSYQIQQELSHDLDPPENMPGGYTKIVHPCALTINYMSYCPIPGNVDIPPISQEEFLRDSRTFNREKTINTLTVSQKNMEIWTTDHQYLLALDIVNNLFLHIEPGIKERLTLKTLSRRFHLQLAEDQTVEVKVEELREKLRDQAMEIQASIREDLNCVRSLEHKLYTLCYSKDDECDDEELKQLISETEEQVNDKKDVLNMRSEEMAVMVSLAKETHLKQQLLSEDIGKDSERQTRRTHFIFHEVKWKLVNVEAPANISVAIQPKGIANFIMKNFEYRSVASVDSDLHEKSNQNHHSHEFKIGDFELSNLLDNQKFQTILRPQVRLAPSNLASIRVFCKVRPPVGGIPVKERIELNILPLHITVTNTFYRAFRNFFFPDPSLDIVSKPASPKTLRKDGDSRSEAGSVSERKSRLFSKFRRSSPSLEKQSSLSEVCSSSLPNFDDRSDEARIMADRARNNQTFHHIQIPKVPLTVSYHSDSRTNKVRVPSLDNMRLDIPCIEYKNKTWTWQDLASNIKNSCQKVLMQQAFQQKVLKVKDRKKQNENELPSPEDNLSAKKLDHLFPQKQKKGLFARKKKS